MCACLCVFCLVLSLFLWKSSFQGLFTLTICAEGESIPFHLEVICSHIILSNRNKKAAGKTSWGAAGTCKCEAAHFNFGCHDISSITSLTWITLPYTAFSLTVWKLQTCFLIWIAQRKTISKSGCYSSRDVGRMQKTSFEFVTYREYIWTSLPITHSLGLFLCQRAIPGWYLHFTNQERYAHKW